MWVRFFSWFFFLILLVSLFFSASNHFACYFRLLKFTLRKNRLNIVYAGDSIQLGRLPVSGQNFLKLIMFPKVFFTSSPSFRLDSSCWCEKWLFVSIPISTYRIASGIVLFSKPSKRAVLLQLTLALSKIK